MQFLPPRTFEHSGSPEQVRVCSLFFFLFPLPLFASASVAEAEGADDSANNAEIAEGEQGVTSILVCSAALSSNAGISGQCRDVATFCVDSHSHWGHSTSNGAS